MQGFSARNLWRMRNFYLEYKNNTKLPPLVAEIGWSHNIILMEKCRDPLEREFFIDLLLYHRQLKNLIAIELKATEFKPEYAGQMQFYLAMLDDKVRKTGENPSIGIIICKTKRRTIVEYTLKSTDSPVGISDYSISKNLPKDLKGLLPSPNDIIKSLSYITED
jgi:hypothetical protein